MTMPNPTHTPEPRWRLVRNNERVWIDRNGEAVISLLWSPQAADLLARIVDDHNTLAGLTDPAAELAELVTALRDMREAVDTYENNEHLEEIKGGPELVRAADAALAHFTRSAP